MPNAGPRSPSSTALVKRLGVSGYYVLILPVQILKLLEIFRQIVPIHNRAEGGGVPADELVGTEFSQLVRFSLRRVDDPLILDPIRVAGALLKTDAPCGPVWHRYNGDGYGEHDDDSPYDGTSGTRSSGRAQCGDAIRDAAR